MNKGFRKDTRCQLCNIGEPHTRLEHRREMRPYWGKNKRRPTTGAVDGARGAAKWATADTMLAELRSYRGG